MISAPILNKKALNLLFFEAFSKISLIFLDMGNSGFKREQFVSSENVEKIIFQTLITSISYQGQFYHL